MGQRILLVDDQPQNLRLLEGILGPYGYSISAASSGDEAMRSIATDAPDLVLLDVVMPGMTGYDVCRQIRANDATKFVPIVMMTASPDQDKVAAIESGADDFVFKPFDKQELLARIRSLLRIKSYHDTRVARAALPERSPSPPATPLERPLYFLGSQRRRITPVPLPRPWLPVGVAVQGTAVQLERTVATTPRPERRPCVRGVCVQGARAQPRRGFAVAGLFGEPTTTA